MKLAFDQAMPVCILQKRDHRQSGFTGIFFKINHCHAQAVARITANRYVDLPIFGSLPRAVGQRDVFPADRACGNHVDQLIHGLALSCDHHQTAGVFVKPVNNAGSR